MTNARPATLLRISIAALVGIAIGAGSLYCWDHHRRYSRPEVIELTNRIVELENQRIAIANDIEDARGRIGAIEQSSGLGHPDDAIARDAVRSLVSKGAAALPSMRELAMSASSPIVRKRAKDVIGQITGNWGSQVDLVWKRSLADATGQGKPILLLQLFGNLDDEFCSANGTLARTVTFSDKAVIEAIEANFIPVWESIAPVSTVTYHLDSDRSEKGISNSNGEIAVYFCRPDGKVFDILPGLHAPASLLEAMDTALTLYTASDSGQNLDQIRQHHAGNPQNVFAQQEFVTLKEMPDRSEDALQTKIDDLEAQILTLKNRARELAEAPDRATHELRQGNSSNIIGVYGKALMSAIAPRDPTARDQIHRRLASVSQLSAPDDWKEFVFEEVLGQQLEGTAQVFE